jgi:transcriptional regulator with XRE-family HTH domain
MEYQKTIVRRIKEFRLQKGISQRQLALSSGKDPQSLERVENGKSCPTVFYLNEICKTLDISIKDFFDFSIKFESE